MGRKKIITGLCIVISIIAAGFIKDDTGYPIEKIAEQLNYWALNYPAEKVYLQLDKPYYAVGDSIWFKAYVTIGGKHKLSGLSGVLNVELIDDQDSVKRHIKLPLVSGLTWGDFVLPDTLQGGNYRIRAYTNWMRNAGEDYFFDRHITIVNAISNKVFAKTNYTFTTQNGQQNINTIINYTDLDGNAYANREVKYTVVLGQKTFRGKGTTDDKGNLDISFANPPSSSSEYGIITTNLTLGDKDVATKTIPIKATSANVDVQFFPESGYLVNNISSKVAFKAVGADGLGVPVKGTVTDNDNKVVASFSSQHLGMGEFTMEPLPGQTYKADVVFADGSEKIFDLPVPVDKGYVLDIDDSDTDVIKVKISASRDMLVANPDDTVSLLAQSGGEIYYAAKSRPGSSNFTAVIPKKRFPTGIVQFTLFSSKEGPLNQRLVFVQNPDLLNLDVSSDRQTYGPGQKVTIKLNAKNGDLKPVQGSFSVAVTDETKVPVNEADESTILSNLLLTSDLKGYVEQPNYYFTDVNEKTRSDLDVLMLTQGYSRFEWKQILNNNFPEIVYEPEKTLEISGQIKTLSGRKPIAHAKVSLVSTSHGFFYIDTVTDEKGNFTFSNLAFGDSVRFIIQARTEKNGKYVQIDLNNTSPQKVTGDKNAPDIKVNINDGMSAYLKNSRSLYDEQLKYGLAKRTITLKEVVIKSTRPVIKHSANLNGPGNADQVLTANQLPPGCVNFSDCMQGYLFGVVFRNGVPYSTRGGMMTLNIDGIFLPADEISMINMTDVESIEVLRTAPYFGIYGSQAGPGGVIVINTKTGDPDDESYLSQPAPGIIVYAPIGYAKVRTFYSPQYDNPKTNIPVADLRSTIYWNPNLITDKDGNTSFQFFNAGGKGTYRVVVEGIDNDGDIGRRVYTYKVE